MKNHDIIILEYIKQHPEINNNIDSYSDIKSLISLTNDNPFIIIDVFMHMLYYNKTNETSESAMLFIRLMKELIKDNLLYNSTLYNNTNSIYSYNNRKDLQQLYEYFIDTQMTIDYIHNNQYLKDKLFYAHCNNKLETIIKLSNDNPFAIQYYDNFSLLNLSIYIKDILIPALPSFKFITNSHSTCH